jgi:hypothetical protein
MSDRNKEKRIQIMARYLYERMPGARPVPTDEDRRLWGEVDGTDEYAFCEGIARLIESADAHTHVDHD